jgi:hypothetical protein
MTAVNYNQRLTLFPFVIGTPFRGHFIHAGQNYPNEEKWQITREPNMLMNRARGRYYVKSTVTGKQKWVVPSADQWTPAKAIRRTNA